jgi:hypothetical protein
MYPSSLRSDAKIGSAGRPDQRRRNIFSRFGCGQRAIIVGGKVNCGLRIEEWKNGRVGEWESGKVEGTEWR